MGEKGGFGGMRLGVVWYFARIPWTIVYQARGSFGWDGFGNWLRPGDVRLAGHPVGGGREAPCAPQGRAPHSRALRASSPRRGFFLVSILHFCTNRIEKE